MLKLAAYKKIHPPKLKVANNMEKQQTKFKVATSNGENIDQV